MLSVNKFYDILKQNPELMVERSDYGIRKAYCFILIIVCFFSFFLNNRVIPADLMESRNLATAQEMIRNNNFLIPTLNGELRLEKPPLPTWIAAGVEMIAPGSLSAQRCASGIAATLMGLFLFFLVFRISRNNMLSLMSSLILVTSFNVILIGRTASWDIYCHSFMLAAILFLFQGFDKEGKQWTQFILAGIFMGLSFLSKGPVSFYAMLLPFLIAYFWVYYRLSMKEKIGPLILMTVIFLIIAFWWNGYIYILHEDIARSVIQKESSAWINHNVRPWYYYVQFPAEFGIWALFAVTAIIYFFFFKKKEYDKEYKFSIIWFISSLVLLSIIPEKKTRYLLPILIPGSILTAIYIYQNFKVRLTKIEKNLFRINASVVAFVAMLLPVLLYVLLYKEDQVSIFVLILACFFCWGLGIIILKFTFEKNGPNARNIFVSIVLLMVMVLLIFLNPIGKLFINDERESIRALRNNKEIENLDFYYNENEELRIELVYESNQIIQALDISDDSLVYCKLPFVFISGLPIDSLFRDKEVTIEKIGNFDNNWRKTSHKRYHLPLKREAAIIKTKIVENE